MELRLRTHARVLFLGAFFAFVLNKLVVRPALEGTEIRALEVFIYSFPNFCEAVMGVTLVSLLLLTVRERVASLRSARDRPIYLVATVFSAAYVISQEFGVHNLGGNNVFHPNDVVASVIGLVATCGLYLRYGLLVGRDPRH